MSGKVLDSFALRKPTDWEADYVVRNLFEQYFISNYTTFDFLEDTGAQLCLRSPTSLGAKAAILQMYMLLAPCSVFN